MQDSRRFAIAVDIGGTFTDIVIADNWQNRFVVSKTSSTPENPATGFFNAVDDVSRLAEVEAEAVEIVFHGSTVATNAILEHKGARTALLTTRGFRHVLDIGRAEIPREANLYGWVKPKRPIRPRDILEVEERVLSDGTVAAPLDVTQLEPIARQIERGGYQAVAIALIHAYANPCHEVQLHEFLASRLPHIEISSSSAVLPVFREYERSMATVMNAMVQPLVGRYIRLLEDGLKDRRIEAPLFIMKSNGGIFSPKEAAHAGAHMALSGPAAGASGAAFLGRLGGIEDMITIDIGGTSADISLIRQGQPQKSTTTRINDLPLALPVIDIHTIGAGGGSIASIAENGAILVGPQSAGAVPGPAAYGEGGTQPTVTDANLVLGRLPPSLLDGAVKLDTEAASAAIDEKIARPLGTSVTEAALGILAIVNETMNSALKLMTVERGLDPADFTLAAFGGAGPVHGGELMRLLNSRQLLVPRHPGILCATGLLSTDLRYDFALTRLQRAGHYDLDDIAAAFDRLSGEAAAKLSSDGISTDRHELRRMADLRYAGQGTELTVPFPDGPITNEIVASTIRGFHDLHRQLYSFSDLQGAVEFVNLRLEATGRMDPISPPQLVEADTSQLSPDDSRMAVLQGLEKQQVPVWRRERLRAGHRISGPAIIDQLDTTTVLFAGQHGKIDRLGNILIREDAP
ncbi:MAG: 5-oxoprolinase [Porticoccaceae bacterium]|nr:5-oxoprolinase [Porticoccaceae bacterium]